VHVARICLYAGVFKSVLGAGAAADDEEDEDHEGGGDGDRASEAAVPIAAQLTGDPERDAAVRDKFSYPQVRPIPFVCASSPPLPPIRPTY
jgi:hypothetical protein